MKKAPKSRRRRSREEAGAATEEKLVRFARRSFASVGFHGACMDALCAKAGLTRGALYHHFGGKLGLFEAVVRQMDAEIIGELNDMLLANQDRWLGFTRCCRAYLSMALKPDVQRIMLKDAPAILGARLQDIELESSLSLSVDMLRQLMADGRIAPGKPEALARMLHGAISDAAIWIANHDDPKAALNEAEHALQTLLNGLEIEH